MEPDFQVGIIGAGFAGLVAALRLKKNQKESFVIFERAADVGGTWRDNLYPGCACDVASHLYSFADEPNPNWKNLYATQPDILAYIQTVVDRNKLRNHIRFNTDIVEARFIEENGCWQLTDAYNTTTTVKILLAALGPLNRPHIPAFQGLNTFLGKVFHSAQWDTGCSLTGKNVAVIGTGASAVQLVPSIAAQVKSLLVFQRTPAWISYRLDSSISEAAQQRFKRFPLFMKLQRESIFWLNELIGLGFIGSTWINALMKRISMKKLADEVNDANIRKKLTPDYTIGCKRILKSDDFYPTFNRPNVQLVTENIDVFTETGIKTKTGQEYPVDIVILGTGFHVADLNFSIQIIGKTNENLFDVWRKTGGESYKGITTANFPNLAFLLGPNTGLGHNSVLHIMESQMNYIMRYIRQINCLGERGYLDVKEPVQTAYNRRLQQQFEGTVWRTGCRSWYVNEAGKNTTLYPRLNTHFRRLTSRFTLSDYQVVN
ncbi:flavin-containing monooxygenase [Spirosoma pollinicola]|uniref:4-hydroxyacetophenone monooxygenase n=1 Tax=Spirosoma pollinicola TaxID=2057025 RepID=A0A2K8Z242_9BACT|nr:NAD(P)/FAD-dependent oxidoreductase [Spirosoma pollinicola]AUD03899.1 4-hydroxyacetophenone monooxygenase [Spirosoma pollinicola]